MKTLTKFEKKHILQYIEQHTFKKVISVDIIVAVVEGLEEKLLEINALYNHDLKIKKIKELLINVTEEIKEKKK